MKTIDIIYTYCCKILNKFEYKQHKIMKANTLGLPVN